MLLPGTRLQNRYLIVEPIGKGGMGAVYRAKDERLRSTVALKQTSVVGDSLRRAFEREAHLLASLKHPALPKVIDHFVEGAGQFLVMEFIPGQDLAEMLRQKGAAFSCNEVIGWANQLLDALEYIHTQEPPIIHRDIKPQNLKLTARGQIILLDFGLAKGSAGQMSRGEPSVLGYTPFYAPLEQIQGTGTNPNSDLYSLAATCYHLITNLRPADAVARATSLLSGKRDPLRPANEVNSLVPQSIANLLNRAMSLNPAERPSTASEMLALFEEASERPRHQMPPTSSSLPDTIRIESESEETKVRHRRVHRRPLVEFSTPKRSNVEQKNLVPELPAFSKLMTSEATAIEPTSEKFSPNWLVAAVGAVLVAGVVGGTDPSAGPVVMLVLVIGMFTCQIIVAVRVFQNEGALKGILSLLCGLFGFIWGWTNAGKLRIKKIMPIWSLLIIVYAILGVLNGGYKYDMGTPTP